MKQMVTDIFEKKMFRSNIIEEFRKKENQSEDFSLKMVEGQHTFLLLNALLLSVYASRGKRRLVQFNYIFGSLTYTHACVALYGEKIEFDKMLRQNNILGFYLRSRYVDRFPNDIKSELYRTMNLNFLNKYVPIDQHEKYMRE